MKRPSLPDEHGGVTFEQFAEACLGDYNDRLWNELLAILKNATPEGRWPPKLDAALKPMIINFAWASAVTKPKGDSDDFHGAEARKRALKFLKASEKANRAWDSLYEFGTEPPVCCGFDTGIDLRRIWAKMVLDRRRPRRGRPSEPQHGYLIALCSSLFAALTGKRGRANPGAPLARMIDHVADIVKEAQKHTGNRVIRLSLEPEARRKRVERMAGQNAAKT